MAAVLLLVGRGLEHPSIVAQMLDLEKFPAKPQYAMAPEVGPGSLQGRVHLCAVHAPTRTSASPCLPPCIVLFKVQPIARYPNQSVGPPSALRRVPAQPRAQDACARGCMHPTLMDS